LYDTSRSLIGFAKVSWDVDEFINKEDKLRESQARLAGIVESSTEEEDLIKSYELGANSYVRKPIAFEQFLEATRSLGLYWLLLNRTESGDQ